MIYYSGKGLSLRSTDTHIEKNTGFLSMLILFTHIHTHTHRSFTCTHPLFNMENSHRAAWRYGAESLGMNALIRTVNGEIGCGGETACGGGGEWRVVTDSDGGGKGRQKEGTAEREVRGRSQRAFFSVTE